jgi:hypothetical protein
MEVIEEGKEAAVAAEAPPAEEAAATEPSVVLAEPTGPRIRFAEDLVAAGALPARKKKTQKAAGKAAKDAETEATTVKKPTKRSKRLATSSGDDDDAELDLSYASSEEYNPDADADA